MGTSQTEASVKSVYFAAIEIQDSTQRSHYLDEACHDDDDLRGEVEQLLAAQQVECSDVVSRAIQQLNPQADYESCCNGALHSATCDWLDPSTHPMIDRYKLLEEIGRGGMGTVYMAQQTEPIKRRVALKLINPGMDSREVIARFEAERQALAMMDHPNIARVIDAGTTEAGRPYFVMELVRGIPITEYCQQHHLKLEESLRLFVDVCHAVQHAHQKGIIHRDIKPSNVMVNECDGCPAIKVIDFGVAKALHHDLTEKTLFTQFSQIIGTPLYISPEQAGFGNMDVDTRSDVYSLGVLLYELLTGTTPFDRQQLTEAGLDGARQIICEEEPLRPSIQLTTLAAAQDSTIKARPPHESKRLALKLRNELDWIVMKALEKDRGRRYQTANDLAQDIERHLQNEPIEAKPPTPLTRLAKWSRRHVVLVWTLVVCSLFVTATIASWLGGRISLQLAVAAEVNQDMNSAVAALKADQTEVAKSALSGSRITLRQLGGSNEALLKQIDLLSDELKRHEEFLSLYKKARRHRDSSSQGLQLACDAIALYGLPVNEDWQKEMLNTGVPEEFVERVAEQVYEMLVLIAHDNLLWMVPKKYSDEKKLQVIDEAHSLLKRASEIHTPTKGYYWVLATCSQRMGDLTEGAVRVHHDTEALRLRALAEGAPPQNAAELFYISRDRSFGCAADWVRRPFSNPFKEGELLAAYREMLRVEPTYYNALFFNGLQLSKEGKHAEAVQAWNGCLAAYPADSVANCNRGFNLANLGFGEESMADYLIAVEDWRARLASTPEATNDKKGLAGVLREYGDSLRIMEKPTEARAALEEALLLSKALVAVDPENPIYQRRVEEAKRALAKLDEVSAEDGSD